MRLKREPRMSISIFVGVCAYVVVNERECVCVRAREREHVSTYILFNEFHVC